ncbi:MAG: class I SAM-dependent methyltransferase, partial [Acidobacteriota bacterium]|nr:class I SAM-dependent methyltransferase [Acidobacteriota bacterium]
ADIGSGTGISSFEFAQNGNKVFGVEPNAEMRSASVEYLNRFDDFHAVDGTAQRTGIDSHCVDLLVAAQAFHWFCTAAAVEEFRRIIRPGGFAALVWNERLLDANPFHREFEKLLEEFGTDYEQVRHDKLPLERIEKTFGRRFESRSFPNRQVLDFEGLRGRVLSSSYMPDQESEDYLPMSENLESLFAEHEENGRISVLYKTIIYFCKF